MAPQMDRARVAETLDAFGMAAAMWYGAHGYRNNWYWPKLDEALRRLDIPALNTALDNKDYLGEGDTPFERIQSGFYKVETYTPNLLAAMEEAVKALEK